MIIFYFSDSKQILNYYPGFYPVVERDGKVYIDNELLLNNTGGITWKYVADQILERDETGFACNADYYEVTTPEQSPDERLAAIEMALLDLAEAIL